MSDPWDQERRTFLRHLEAQRVEDERSRRFWAWVLRLVVLGATVLIARWVAHR